LAHDFEDAPMPKRMKFIIGAMVFGVFFVVAVGIQRTNEMKTAEAASSSQVTAEAASSSQVTAEAEPIKAQPEKDVEAKFKDRTWVRAMQKYLTATGCDAGKADGLMGPATRTAMKCSGFDKAELTAQVDRWIDGR
jgi:peptidoglycan hydrolase-like protein with peptidoglycan-binding domain